MPGVKSAEKLLHEHEVETATNFVTYYSYRVRRGKFKVRWTPQMNSGYERDARVQGLWGDHEGRGESQNFLS